MRRREFIAGLTGAAAWPVVARAQQPEPMRRIGVLMAFAATDSEAQLRVNAFEAGLRDLGWTKGRNLRIEYRWAPNDPNMLRMAAVMGLIESQARGLVRAGRIGPIVVGKRVMIPRNAIEAFIAYNLVPPCRDEIPGPVCASSKSAIATTSSGLKAVTAGSAARALQIADGTIRRELGVLRASLNHGHKNGRLTRVVPVQLPDRPEPRDRWLTRKEAAGLLRAALREPRVRLHLPLFILWGCTVSRGRRRSSR